jgi:hypothetical protein
MHAFDILAESKMRQWERERREGETAPAPKVPAVHVDSSDSLERKLYLDIRRLVVRSCMEPDEHGRGLMETAQKLQVQLNARLEKSGYNLLSRLFSDEISTLRSAALAARGDREALEAMLRRQEL